ncbi:DegT/DnrJ/EryC1/StrS aminotransferase family protein [Sphingomonas sp. IC-11]|uniref:DegT/DnrJ/EryC1/StrS family aminotransferase n=1 Tax=Sphingomonas sp. IC-11 TaxID=2898528 RepID=UPI001E35CC0D|nr:DegT/DnrJ/EryC1/StrS aminotransferase family protein [Sphingomonas sp. IC-11]MCD2317016.1 DegT/DnrJ/EryC1/StrS aminotransferase family protein [Sphingomonas sp. IC-11]
MSIHMRASVAVALADRVAVEEAVRIDLQPRSTAPITSRWPVHETDEIGIVSDVLRSGRVNALHHGERTAAFETAFARLVGLPHAIAVANGTLALELALHALGLGPGDEVIVPARSFIASASCVAAVGATPIFADVDSDTQGLTVESVAAALTPRTKAIIAVHIAGWPCEIAAIARFAGELGLKLIEDCAQAHGATLGGGVAGSFGDAAAFSFCTDKIMSTGGEGGLLLLRDEEAWSAAWSRKDHGKSPLHGSVSGSPGVFRWLHERLGTNLRLTEMQSAIGLLQLGKLKGWLTARRANAERLNRALAHLPSVRLTLPPADVGHAYYKYYAFLRPEELRPGYSRDLVLSRLIAAGVPAGSGICPEIYRERAFDGSSSVPERRLPVCQMLGETSLMFPVDPTLDAEQMEDMAARTASVIAEATR